MQSAVNSLPYEDVQCLFLNLLLRPILKPNISHTSETDGISHPIKTQFIPQIYQISQICIKFRNSNNLQ